MGIARAKGEGAGGAGWLERRRRSDAFAKACQADDLGAAMAACDAAGLGPQLHKVEIAFESEHGNAVLGDAMRLAWRHRRWHWVAPLAARAPKLAQEPKGEEGSFRISSMLLDLAKHAAPTPRAGELSAVKALLGASAGAGGPRPWGYPFDMSAGAHKAASRQGLPLTCFGLAAQAGRADLLGALADYACSRLAGQAGKAEREQLLLLLLEAAQVSEERATGAPKCPHRECADLLSAALGRVEGQGAAARDLRELGHGRAAEQGARRQEDPKPSGAPQGEPAPAFHELMLRELAKLSEKVDALSREVERLGGKAKEPSKIGRWRSASAGSQGPSEPGSPRR